MKKANRMASSNSAIPDSTASSTESAFWASIPAWGRMVATSPSAVASQLASQSAMDWPR